MFQHGQRAVNGPRVALGFGLVVLVAASGLGLALNDRMQTGPSDALPTTERSEVRQPALASAGNPDSWFTDKLLEASSTTAGSPPPEPVVQTTPRSSAIAEQVRERVGASYSLTRAEEVTIGDGTFVEVQLEHASGATFKVVVEQLKTPIYVPAVTQGRPPADRGTTSQGVDFLVVTGEGLFQQAIVADDAGRSVNAMSWGLPGRAVLPTESAQRTKDIALDLLSQVSW